MKGFADDKIVRQKDGKDNLNHYYHLVGYLTIILWVGGARVGHSADQGQVEITGTGRCIKSIKGSEIWAGKG